MRGPELYEQIQLWTVKQTLLWTSSFAGPRTLVVPLHQGKSSRFSAYPFTRSPWRLCNTFRSSRRFSHLGACMCRSICTNTRIQVHIQLTSLAVSQWNTGMLPNVFRISKLQPTRFSRLSPSAVSLSLSLTLCVYLLPLLRKPASVRTRDMLLFVFLFLFFAYVFLPPLC